MSRFYRSGFMAALNGSGFKAPYNPFFIVAYIDGYLAGRAMRQVINRKRWKV